MSFNSNSSLSALVQLHGLPPLPKSLNQSGSSFLNSAQSGSSFLNSTQSGSSILGSAQSGSSFLNFNQSGGSILGSAHLGGSSQLGSSYLSSTQSGSSFLGGYSSVQSGGSYKTYGVKGEFDTLTGRSDRHVKIGVKGRPSPPIPPPRPTSRRSSSSGSSFRASPEREQIINTNTPRPLSSGDVLRSSPRSLSSSPHSPHVDSGLGRSSADSLSEPRAFVRVLKSPQSSSTVGPYRLDAQLAQLKNDMQQLRQMDMSLLGHLLQIHQGIQDLRTVLVPPPGPAPSSALPLFQTTGYNSRSSRITKQKQESSRLSLLSSGASRLFSRRSSSDKLMAEAMASIALSPPHSSSLKNRDQDSDSLSSIEFENTLT